MSPIYKRTLWDVSYKLVIAKGRSLRLQHCSDHKLLPLLRLFAFTIEMWFIVTFCGADSRHGIEMQ
jgi:hypothetical protein